METLTFNQLTEYDIRAAVRAELSTFFSGDQINQVQPDRDEVGGIELAMRVTGKAKATLYSMASRRELPHSKRGKHLYFSKNELLRWIADGKRKTQGELALDAESFSSEKSKQTKLA